MKINKSEIARKSGISRVTISKIFNKKQKNSKLETLRKIAIALDISLEDLTKEIL